MDYDNEFDIFTLTGVAAAVICTFLAILFNIPFILKLSSIFPLPDSIKLDEALITTFISIAS